MISKSVVTLAVGNDYYRQLAKNLLLSFLKWNDPSEISFQLITDDPSYYSDIGTILGVTVQKIELPEELKSFTAKFYLSRYITANQNLFVDCDCIVYKPLNKIFKKFEGHDFSVIGKQRQNGDFFGDIATINKQFNIGYLPHFVGSIYYYTNSETSKKIFTTALELKGSYDKIGLVRLRGKENEEPLIAIAMAIYNQIPLEEDGTVKADCMYFKKCDTNVLTGKINLVPLSSYQYSKTSFDPAIIHFNDSFSEKHSYLSECYRLNYPSKYMFITELVVFVRYKAPMVLSEMFKYTFRPVYHFLSKPSAIKPNSRIKK